MKTKNSNLVKRLLNCICKRPHIKDRHRYARMSRETIDPHLIMMTAGPARNNFDDFLRYVNSRQPNADQPMTV